MQTEILYRPAYAAARLVLEAGERVKAEAGAMVAMSGVEIETSTQGGLLKGLRRSLLGGESFYVNTFTAQASGAELWVAPALPGDMVSWELEHPLLVTSGCYVASSADVDVDTSWGGARTFFSREGLFLLRVTGRGTVVLSSYGAIHHVDLQPGQTYTFDTGHLVAWSEGMQYGVRKVGGWKSTLFSGEGLVTDFVGPGRVYLQTRSQDAFLSWLIPQLPQPSSS
ncbi:TIGR00266 family protein [Nocardioides bruguierae]|uniref:TIGR00266 family protein n=1 Tax=Nocardioides bruguierae TaxID=2945102 RepID=A0A9X2D5A4_9ACTN|nr:TIGR00266 family protein [Nocardioides bruguierae]MCL8024922.1 TIGR00266 family protein [Nocardioides bruguierae]MCM0619325.1 TIGR00266 family protein [Nocardioides bruguierae]